MNEIRSVSSLFNCKGWTFILRQLGSFLRIRNAPKSVSLWKERKQPQATCTKVYDLLYTSAGYLGLLTCLTTTATATIGEDLSARVAELTAEVNVSKAQNQEVMRVLNALTAKVNAIPLSLNIGEAVGTRSTIVDLPINFVEGAVPVSTMQFDLVLPVGISSSTVLAGAVITAAGKGVQTSLVAGALRVLIFGVNANAIGSGILVTVRLKVASNITVGKKLVNFNNVVAADPDGLNVPLTITNGSITVN